MCIIHLLAIEMGWVCGLKPIEFQSRFFIRFLKEAGKSSGRQIRAGRQVRHISRSQLLKTNPNEIQLSQGFFELYIALICLLLFSRMHEVSG